MHDDESDTFVMKTIPESVCDNLKENGINAVAKEIGSDEVENP